MGQHTVIWEEFTTSVCGDGVELRKGKGEEFVIGKGLLIVELCPKNFDEV